MRNEASKLMANPDIAMMVESIRSENEAKKLQSLRALEVNDREKVLSRLRHFLDHADSTDTNKIQAAKLLGMTVGLFKDVTITEDARSSNDIARQLEDRLAVRPSFLLPMIESRHLFANKYTFLLLSDYSNNYFQILVIKLSIYRLHNESGNKASH